MKSKIKIIIFLSFIIVLCFQIFTYADTTTNKSDSTVSKNNKSNNEKIYEKEIPDKSDNKILEILQ